MNKSLNKQHWRNHSPPLNAAQAHALVPVAQISNLPYRRFPIGLRPRLKE
jgi:hypothetical protein